MFRSRKYFITVILSLSISVGLNLVVWNIANKIYFNPELYEDEERIIRIGDVLDMWERSHRRPISSYILYEERKRELDLVESIGMNSDYQGNFSFGEGNGDQVPGSGWSYTASMFDIFSLKPEIGRVFTEEEEALQSKVALLTYGCWKNEYAGAADVIGKKLYIDGTPFDIIGVMKADFVPPPAREMGYGHVFREYAVFPLVAFPRWVNDPLRRAHVSNSVFAKMKEGVTLAQVYDRVKAITDAGNEAVGMTQTFRENNHRVVVMRLNEDLVLGIKSYLMLMLLSSLLVFTLGCTTVAGFGLVYNSGRKRDFAIQNVLGARYLGVMTGISVEAMLLSAAGCAGGFIMFVLADPLANALGLNELLSTKLEFKFDGFAAGCLLSMFALVSLVIGITSIMSGLGLLNSRKSLGDHSRTSSACKRAILSRRAFIFTQISFTTIIMVFGVLLLRSLVNVLNVDPGYDTSNIGTIIVQSNTREYERGQLKVQMQTICSALRALPGVKAVGINNWAGHTFSFNNGSRRVVVRERDNAHFNYSRLPRTYSDLADEGFFEVLGIKLVAGRFFNQSDANSDYKPVIIDTKNAKMLFSDEDPIGRTLFLASNRTDRNQLNDPDFQDRNRFRVIGVVENVARASYLDPPDKHGMAYLYTQRSPPYWQTYSMRTERNPRIAVLEAKSIIQELYPGTPIYYMSTFEDDIKKIVFERTRFVFIIITILVIAIALGIMGIYIAVRASVDTQEREVGMRVAVGARPVHIIKSVLLPWASVCVLAICAGLGASFILMRNFQDVLYQTTHWDPASYFFVIALMLPTVLFASSISVKKTLGRSPARALRVV